MKKIIVLGVISMVLLQVYSCKKDSSSTTVLKVKLTDAPYNAQEVNVDIRQVTANFRDDSTGFVNLSTVAGVYNLLKLQNGVDTLLGSGTVPTGTLKEIRFILGPMNTIKIDNKIYPLTIPSGEESGLKIKVNKKLAASLDSLLIDFDADLSIYKTGTNEYKLKPVLKVKY